jgi:hypothetical protein
MSIIHQTLTSASGDDKTPRIFKYWHLSFLVEMTNDHKFATMEILGKQNIYSNKHRYQLRIKLLIEVPMYMYILCRRKYVVFSNLQLNNGNFFRNLFNPTHSKLKSPLLKLSISIINLFIISYVF